MVALMLDIEGHGVVAPVNTAYGAYVGLRRWPNIEPAEASFCVYWVQPRAGGGGGVMLKAACLKSRRSRVRNKMNQALGHFCSHIG